MCKCSIEDLAKYSRRNFRYPKAWGQMRMKRPICPICGKSLNLAQVAELRRRGIIP